MELGQLNDKQRALIDPKDRKQLGRAGETYDEAETRAWTRLEKELHEQYIGFLNRNNLDYFHSPMSKKSVLVAGHPDFSVYRDSMIMFVEFKVGDNKLSPVQDERIERLRRNGNVVIVSNWYEVAMYETKRFFDL